ncbi:hypothetical protein ASPZODRAFT_107265 [Penicilliopsis zonata CBS 506.65]|uniref:Autophagy-related protein 14 n=1 Tax=Penicilliopsis zonata CBS 506.65 TaxID=1073090 RepID=A0A1L9SVC1_9EURO|nr:hypothetical protein ASPZODRAFT_107265 [Penicilliopsis zonata CBS 506.65]OJJ51064.1 hypothetical protein ASPZODRAFT_107265 [Penicilliopsis zonata CBS 506.65]
MPPIHDTDDGGSRPERPWLFPATRRLRHLHGVSVRNLVVTPPPSRVRGKTIDDDDIPNTMQSPAKLLAQKEARGAHHSRSFTDLAAMAWGEGQGQPREDQPQPPPQPLPPPPSSSASTQARRRRSTLPWNEPDPLTRRVKLEDIMKSRMADTWFSLHGDGEDDEPVYISEVTPMTTNPSFRFFDLNICGPRVSRQDHLTLRLWAKTVGMAEYILLLDLQLHLRSLQFLGRSLDSFHQPLPANSVLFHFPDGVYANLTSTPPTWSPLPLPTRRPVTVSSDRGVVQSTSSYDALMRLATLDECVQDAVATREKLEAQISAILEHNQRAVKSTSDVSKAQDRLALTRHAIATERRHVRATVKRRDELTASIGARKAAMSHGRDAQDRARSHLPEAQDNLVSNQTLLAQTTDETKGQIRRIAEDLLEIYPIEPIANKPLAFTIAGHALPNSSFDDRLDRETVAAALGAAAHLVYLLSFYLSIPLPYPVNPHLSTSLIQDPVSLALPQRTYPLYPVSVQYRFEYAVFLLNKDIEFLLNSHGLRVLDIRHTLPNLKYLLYVLTAGTAELPARKAGGIRGLLPGRLTPSLLSRSRRDSDDSVVSGQSGQSVRQSLLLQDTRDKAIAHPQAV